MSCAKAAEQVAQDVALAERDGIGETQDVLGHGLDRGRHGTARASDPRVLEEDDLPVLGQRVDDRRVPVVERAREMLEAKQGQAAVRVAEAPIGVANALGFGVTASGRWMRLRVSCWCPVLFSHRCHAAAAPSYAGMTSTARKRTSARIMRS